MPQHDYNPLPPKADWAQDGVDSGFCLGGAFHDGTERFTSKWSGVTTWQRKGGAIRITVYLVGSDKVDRQGVECFVIPASRNAGGGFSSR